jgi:ubiquinone/menaquinone biosynthesis C-methylase UbiE
MAIRNFLPPTLQAKLWGDRKKWGLVLNEQDEDWEKWQQSQLNFYQDNQRQGFGATVNDAGYTVMSSIDMTGKIVLEIGPGDIRHIHSWQSKPTEYVLADIDKDMLSKGELIINTAGITSKVMLLQRGQTLPLTDESVDVFVSFYSLEHIYPLQPYLQELDRVLKPGGTVVGAIPTEGGFAWGLGRFFTSRRWFKQNTSITPDKIICWEHPNFANHIIKCLDKQFLRKSLSYWPLKWLPLVDINFVIKFIYTKKDQK